MNTTPTTKLTLRPFMWSHDGPSSNPDAPACGYWVDGMPKDMLVQIVNTRASGREPSWQLRYIGLDAELGDYKTEHDALTALQSFVNDPTLLLDAHHKAELDWFDKWGKTPDHFLAKRAHQEAEAWERVIKAQDKQ
jgi:hypothetical protein